MATDTEIQAGPELDARIAREVMGWEICTHDGKPPHFHRTSRRARWTLLEDWRPSTNIAAAWEVLEHFGYFTITQSKSDGEQVSVELEHPPKSARFFHGKADTAPLAICRAAIQAVAGG